MFEKIMQFFRWIKTTFRDIFSNWKLVLVFVVLIAITIVGFMWKFDTGIFESAKKSNQATQGKLKEQFAEQLPDLQKQVEKNPNNPALQQQLAVAKYATGDLQGAKDAYEKGIVLDSENAVMHNNLGNTYRDLGDYAKSETEYRKAMKLNSKLTTPYMNLASIYQYILAKPETALSIYAEGIKNIPDYVDFYNSTALIYEQQGLKQKAIDTFRQALKVQPSNPAAQAGLKRLTGASK